MLKKETISEASGLVMNQGQTPHEDQDVVLGGEILREALGETNVQSVANHLTRGMGE